ncbi:MAG: polysaccharide deacetylase family protein [Phycisphaeraceae bacterium]|nr:polysaccharide deacetylase family protein [Phycisphaeraceae bacterium]
MTDRAVLTFDAEEFDIPLEFRRQISDADQLRIGADGFAAVLDMLDRTGAPATFFITARLALHSPDLVRRAASRHEIASHSWSHTGFAPDHLRRSRETLESVSGAPVIGFRMPRMATVDHAALAEAGYTYNSSENPTWLTRRASRTEGPLGAYFSGPLLNIPATVTPILRLPLFWLAFKRMPTRLFRSWTTASLRSRSYASLYMHPWEFTDLAHSGLPWWIRRPDGARLLDRLAAYAHWLRERATLVTMASLAESIRRGNLAAPDRESALRSR